MAGTGRQAQQRKAARIEERAEELAKEARRLRKAANEVAANAPWIGDAEAEYRRLSALAEPFERQARAAAAEAETLRFGLFAMA